MDETRDFLRREDFPDRLGKRTLAINDKYKELIGKIYCSIEEWIMVNLINGATEGSRILLNGVSPRACRIRQALMHARAF